MFRKSNQLARIASALLCLLMVCGFFSSARTENVLDPSRTVSLSIRYHSQDSALSGAAFHLYKVAEVSSSLHFTLTGPFTDAPVSLDQMLDQSAWKETADTLNRYAQEKSIAPSTTAVTDTDGKTMISSLISGLYLVTGQSLELDWKVYTPETALILLPNRTADGSWLYEVEMNPKPEIEVIERISRQVVKVWNDQGSTSFRPNQLTVELLCNGQPYDAVTLNAANGWSYRWTDLDSRYQWSVREPSVPNGYTAKITQSGERFIITNTLSSTVTPVPDGSLPQTGLLWWPVPVLALAGMGLFLLGWLRQRRER